MSESSRRAHNALVTGGARRIGRGLVESLADAGAGVAVHFGSSSAEAEQFVEDLRRRGVAAVALGADLADPAAASALIPRASAALGPIDWLVNSAAIFEPLGVETTTSEAWDRHMAVNLRAPFLLAQAFAGERQGEPGSIVNVLDWRATHPGADHLPYTISKAALAALTRSLAVALAPAIRVNGVALGAILPPADGGASDALSGVPAERWGRVDEVGRAVRFLLDGSDFITGAVLHLDGGRHLA
jgi:NAD(P)-dependent dehydrogenase (short-subunit alcohol dehydrogenase family)